MPEMVPENTKQLRIGAAEHVKNCCSQDVATVGAQSTLHIRYFAICV